MKKFVVFLFCILIITSCYFVLPALTVSPLNADLSQAWEHFKNRYIGKDGQVPSQTFGGAISEGQSYALLMAWRMGDQKTFDKVWQWTQTHMQRPADHLFAWHWGKTTNGHFGIIDANNATDADQDIAYALYQAGVEWHKPDYQMSALAIIQDLWEHNVTKLGPHYYLTPGPWEGFHSQGILTQAPGYFAPHVYRLFAKLDSHHPWLSIVADGYQWLTACSNLTSTKLPPNWCGIRFEDGQTVFSDVQGQGARDFGYDSVRTYWRMAQDRQTPQAQAYVRSHQWLNHVWEVQGNIPGGYSSTGQPIEDMPLSYGRAALFAQWLTMSPMLDPNKAYEILLAKQFQQPGYWEQDDNYFLSAVVWLSLSVGNKPW